MEQLLKVVILAGGYGTRLSEYTHSIPKPMVPVGEKPIIWHIMQRYAAFGHKDFYVALGYKAEVIKEYFLKFSTINSDFTLDIKSGEIDVHSVHGIDWKITLIDTGQDSMTGGRVKRMQPYVKNNSFMLTYGDGLSDLDFTKLEKFHNDHGKIVTVTAVRPVARFGELDIDGSLVKSFKEKPQVENGWINGGFFICNSDFFDFIDDDSTVLESDPLELAAKRNELIAFKHSGFWQCMDTKRDLDYLNSLWYSKKAPWVENKN